MRKITKETIAAIAISVANTACAVNPAQHKGPPTQRK